MRNCVFCGKESVNNYCSFDCHVNEAKKVGGRVITPNGLPISCFTANGDMLEIAHGDHPDYKWPVLIEYIGPVGEDQVSDFEAMAGRAPNSEEEVRKILSEDHALIYTDGSVALTLYECNYAIWSIRTGECLGGRYASAKNNRMAENCRTRVST